MRNISLSGESLTGIIIGVTILSIAILGILNLILYSTELINVFEKTTQLNILKDNVLSITKKINTSSLQEGEIFYIYKDKVSKNFLAFTGTANAQYKYIDEVGSFVPNLASFTGETYARLLWIEREDTSIDTQNQIIKASLRRLIRKEPNF